MVFFMNQLLLSVLCLAKGFIISPELRQMNEEGIRKVMGVWKEENTISQPNKIELCIEIIDQVASLFAAGSYYYYILSFETMKMELVQGDIEQILGIPAEEYSLEKFLDIMHPDDIVRMHKKERIAADFLFNKITHEELLKYKVIYLFRLKDSFGSYKTILHQAKTFVVSADGKIQNVIGIHTDVTYLNIPIDGRISFVSDSLPSYYADENVGDFIEIQSKSNTQFTSREIEIIKLLAKGLTFKEIANQLFVSPHTIVTHKRNILSKSNSKNTAELVASCIREGVI